MTLAEPEKVSRDPFPKLLQLKQVSGGKALAHALAAQGVTVVFGIPGTHNLAFYDALVEIPHIKHFSGRNEQGTAFMADGYSRASGRVGVCMSTTGPGALNMLGSLGTSYSDSIPVLSIISEIPSAYVGQEKGFFHECREQLKMFEPVVSWAHRINSVSSIPWAVREAFTRLHSGRPRPIVLEIPCDILDATSDVVISGQKISQSYSVDQTEITKAVELLQTSNRPAIWAGGGAISSNASSELIQLAEQLQAPVFTTVTGRGAIPDTHALGMGRTQLLPIARKYLSDCDLLLAVGTRFPQLETDDWSLRLPKTVIQVDLDPSEIGRNYPVSLGIIGDARKVLEQLCELLSDSGDRPDRSQEVSNLKKQILTDYRQRTPKTLRFIDTLRKALPRNTIIVNDLTVAVYWGQVFLEVYEPRTYLYPAGFCTLGFGLPAAIGAKLARPDRPVVMFAGDGGFLFNCQELATVAHYGIPIVSVVFNDNAYGVLKPQQVERYGRNTDEVELTNPNFVELARSFGIKGERVLSTEKLGPALTRGLKADQPWVIEMPITLPWPI